MSYKVFQSIPEFLTYGLLVALLVLNVAGLFQIRNLITDNQANAVVARKQNIQRQEEIKGYIKCIILLRYDNPNLSPASPRADVEKALDKCAVSTVKD